MLSPALKELKAVRDRDSTKYYKNLACKAHVPTSMARCHNCRNAGLTLVDQTERDRRLTLFYEQWPGKGEVALFKVNFSVADLESEYQKIRAIWLHRSNLPNLKHNPSPNILPHFNNRFIPMNEMIRILYNLTQDYDAASTFVEGFQRAAENRNTKQILFDDFLRSFIRMKIFQTLRCLQSLQNPPGAQLFSYSITGTDWQENKLENLSLP